jgi:hypothetical protein
MNSLTVARAILFIAVVEELGQVNHPLAHGKREAPSVLFLVYAEKLLKNHQAWSRNRAQIYI